MPRGKFGRIERRSIEDVHVSSGCMLRFLVPFSASQRPHLVNHSIQIGGGQPEQKHPVQRLQRTHQLPASFQKEARVLTSPSRCPALCRIWYLCWNLTYCLKGSSIRASGTTVMKIASTVQTMAAARATSSSARGSRLLLASSDTDNCRWQLPSGLLIDVIRWQSPCSNPFVENFLLQRKGDPFLRRIWIGAQTAKLQENFLFILCHPLALE